MKQNSGPSLSGSRLPDRLHLVFLNPIHSRTSLARSTWMQSPLFWTLQLTPLPEHFLPHRFPNHDFLSPVVSACKCTWLADLSPCFSTFACIGRSRIYIFPCSRVIDLGLCFLAAGIPGHCSKRCGRDAA